MGVWDAARSGLARAVTAHLGEDLQVVRPDTGGGMGSFPLALGGDTAALRGVLTRPEQAVRLGHAHLRVGEAMLTLRVVDVPDWFGRGVSITSERGETFEVVRELDNGEGILEVTLCRL